MRTGHFGDGGANGGGSCVTGADGHCSVTKAGLKSNVSNVSFTVSGLSAPNLVYDGSVNHDPDGDSDGTAITVIRP